MEELKSLFGDGSLSYEQFEQKLGEAGETVKLANLKTGNYVDKDKYAKAEHQATEWKTKFEALSESTKGYTELQANYDNLKAEHEALQNKVATGEKMSLIDASNVNPKFAKFVYTEVNAMTNDKKDFKTALDEYLKDNGQFVNARGTYVNLQNGAGDAKSAGEKFNDQIRKFLRS